MSSRTCTVPGNAYLRSSAKLYSPTRRSSSARSRSETAARSCACSARSRSAVASLRFCQIGRTSAARMPSARTVAGTTICQRAHPDEPGRRSSGSRLIRDDDDGGRVDDHADDARAKPFRLPDRRVHQRAPRRRKFHPQRVVRNVAIHDDRIEIEVLGLEGRMSVEVVGERLMQMILERCRERQRLAQRRARRQRDDDPRRGPVRGHGGRARRGPRRRRFPRRHRAEHRRRRPCASHRSPTAAKALRDCRRRRHRSRAPALERRARSRGRRRDQLLLPPMPEAREPQTASKVLRVRGTLERRVGDEGHQRTVEEREGAAADRDGSSQASAIRGRSASGDGRSTASRTKVTPSGSVTCARMRQTGIGPLTYACAGGNGGAGRPGQAPRRVGRGTRPPFRGLHWAVRAGRRGGRWRG